ncbi:MAG TPA: flagellar biosynthetic protein FliR [Acetobacteraceae bacterium]|nr:flagellar biosynthetic protein FliR [Acetobacteraceae bacterium]
MTGAEASLLARLPDLANAFVLVLARVGAACMLLPGIGEAGLPMMIRAGFALALTLLLLPVLAPDLPPPPADVWHGLRLLAAELAAGLLLGWLARLVLLALPIAGQLLALLSGQASVLQPDALLGPQGAALGRLFGLAAPVLLLASGLYALPLQALAGSYRVLPPGVLLPAGDSAATAVAAVGACFALSLRLAAPFLLAGIVWQVALAALARLAPQVPVFFLAAPAQLFGGVLLLALLGGTMLAVWGEAANAGFALLPGH